MRPAALVLALLACPPLAFAACAPAASGPKEPLGAMPEVVTTAQPEWIPWSIRAGTEVDADAREHHLADLRQLTSGGASARARWSPDGRKIVFQATPEGARCAQVFVMDLGSGETRQASSGGGMAVDGVFYPAGDRLIYASTRAAGEACPPEPDPSLDLYSAATDGGDARRLLGTEDHDAEADVAPDGSRIVWTSARDGDPELFTANLDGTRVRRLTNAPGYDGEAAFSPDAAKLVWTAERPAGPAASAQPGAASRTRASAHAGASVQAGALARAGRGRAEIWIAGAEGQDARPITRDGHANVTPSFLPDARRVIFASDRDAAEDARGTAGGLDLYVIDPDGPVTAAGGPAVERVTFAGGFDARFSPDGRHVLFTSARGGGAAGETHVFVARWVP